MAVIELSDTPPWLQHLNQDPYGFPKKTAFGTLWKWVDTADGAPDDHGQTEFIRAAIAGDLLHAEMLAEFPDTDVNTQDHQRRTALHWACAMNHTNLVALCLSVPECDTGLRDSNGLTAFDVSSAHWGDDMAIPGLFYASMVEMDSTRPQAALLRLLTITAEPARSEAKIVFPGEALFDPINDRNVLLVKALLARGVDLTAVNGKGDTALHLAADIDNVEIAVRLLMAGSDVDARGNKGDTPLHRAAQTGGNRMVQELLGWDAAPDLRNRQDKTALDLARDPVMMRREQDRKANDMQNRTALHRAAEAGDTEIVRLLLEMGVSADERTSDGMTALMLAAKMGHQAVGEILLDGGASLAATDNAGRSPKDWAATTGHLEFVQLLVEGRIAIPAKATNQNSAAQLPAQERQLCVTRLSLISDVDVPTEEAQKASQVVLVKGATDLNNLTELELATTKREVLVRALFSHLESRNQRGLTPLLQAVFGGDLVQTQVLLDSGADVKASSGRDRIGVLFIAAEKGHTEIANALLAHGAEINAKDSSGNTALHHAAQGGHTDIVNRLLAAGVEIDAKGSFGETAMHRAVWGRHTEIAHALVTGGADIDAKDSASTTALTRAAEGGCTEIVKILLAAGAEIDSADGEGMTALHRAADGGHTGAANALLERGAEIDAADCGGRTALHIVTHGRHRELLNTFLAYGAAIDAKDSEGCTALHYAAENGDNENVRALLAGGAQMNLKDKRGRTALRVARGHRHDDTVNILREAEGKGPIGGTLWGILR